MTTTYTIWPIDCDGRGDDYCVINTLDDNGDVIYLDTPDEYPTIEQAIAAIEAAGAHWIIAPEDEA